MKHFECLKNEFDFQLYLVQRHKKGHERRSIQRIIYDSYIMLFFLFSEVFFTSELFIDYIPTVVYQYYVYLFIIVVADVFVFVIVVIFITMYPIKMIDISISAIVGRAAQLA